MSLSALQLASTGALALLAGLADAAPGQSIVLDPSARSRESMGEDLMSHHLDLDVSWKTKRTVSDVLTDLLDVDGIRVIADRHFWDRPDVLALRHDFASDIPFQVYCAAGIDRGVHF